MTSSIKALLKQIFPREDFEIVFVDNNSTDATGQNALAAGADRVVKETTKGTNFARQRGVIESTGNILAFLDADSEPPTDWLERIEKDLSLPGIAGISGPYDYGLRGIRKSIGDFYEHKILPAMPSILYFIFRRKAGVMIGGNFAVWRKTLEKIGGLPPLKFWGDDSATAMLISRRVGKVFFDPDLIIKSSPRRFEKHGLLFLTLKYAFVYFKTYFSPQFR